MKLNNAVLSKVRVLMMAAVITYGATPTPVPILDHPADWYLLWTGLQCDPSSCSESMTALPDGLGGFSGEVETDGYGDCTNDIYQPQSIGAVQATHCSTPVSLTSSAWRTDDPSEYVPADSDYYEVEGVSASAQALRGSTPYWTMYEDYDCTGYQDSHADPSTPC